MRRSPDNKHRGNTIKLLAVDFETQDDKPKTTKITEVGAAWCDTSTGQTSKMSLFCYEPDYPPQTEFIAELTGITDEMLKRDGIPRMEALTRLLPLIEQADVVFAHKKSFDKTILESTCKLFGLHVPPKEWICTLSEFNWPKKFTCLKLGHLAFEHGLFDNGQFNREMLHRAGDDSELLLHLITSKYSLPEVLAYAREKWWYFKADPLPPWKDGGEHIALAKRVGFSWERCRHDDEHTWPKTWVMRVKERFVTQTKKSFDGLPFRTARIEGV